MIVGNKTGNFAGGVAPESHVFYVNHSFNNVNKKNSINFEELLLKNNIKIINHSYRVNMSEYGSRIHIVKPKFFENLKKSVNSGQILHIWAAGNNDSINRNPYTGGLPHLYPELERGWITVVGVDLDGNIDDGSVKCNEAKNFCIGAPMKLWMRGEIYPGTSFSAPIVSAIAGLVSGKYPWMSVNNLRQTILTSGSNADGKLSTDTGWGVVNAAKAINGPSRFDKRLTDLQGVSKDEKIAFVAKVNEKPNGWNDSSVYKQHDLHSSYTFSNSIKGDAGLIKTGSGPLFLTGWNTYTGNTDVKEGALFFYNSSNLNSKVIIRPNAFLINQSRQIKGDIDNEGGTLVVLANEMDSLPKTKLVYGNVTFNQSSTLVSEIGNTLHVTGKVSLDNTKLKVLVNDDEKKTTFDKKYDALYAEHGIDGAFSSSVDGIDEKGQELKLYEFEIDKDNPSDKFIYITVKAKNSENNLKRSRRSLLGQDKTYDDVTQSIEGAWDQSSNRLTMVKQALELQKILTTSNPEKLAAMLDSRSGQLYASGLALSFQQSAMINRVLGNRLNQITQNSASSGMWFDLYGGKGELKQTGFATGETHFLSGQWGADTRINDNWVIGGAVLAGNGEASFDRWGGQSTSRNIGVSVYSRYGQNRGWYTAGRLGWASIKNKTERKILTNDEKMIGAKHKDNLWSGYLETGYVMHRKQSRITPFVGLAYDRITRGTFAEKGDESAFALKANAASYDQTSGLLGVRFAHRFDWSAGSSWVQAYGLYQRSLKADDLSYKATFVGFPSVHHWVKGIDLPKHSGWVGIGLNTQSTPVFSWQAGYNAQMGGYGKINHLLNLGFRINFI